MRLILPCDFSMFFFYLIIHFWVGVTYSPENMVITAKKDKNSVGKSRITIAHKQAWLGRLKERCNLKHNH